MPSNQNLSKLPEQCYSVHEYTSELILIKRGESGYYTTTFSTQNKEENRALAKKLNAKLGVTPEQEQAMYFGCTFGFSLPGADPDFYVDTPTTCKFVDDERAYSLNEGEFYLLIQTYDEGYDYSIYYRDFSEFDGGQYDDTDITMDEAIQRILEEYDLQDMPRIEYDIDDLRTKTDEVAQARYEAALAKLNHSALETRLNDAKKRSAQQQEGAEMDAARKEQTHRE